MIVQDEAGKLLRLSWEDAAQKERRRSLAPGEYTVRVYRLIRKDESGKEWFISATGNEIKKFSVEQGKQSRLALDESILFRSGINSGPDKLDLMMEFHGENRSGLTVYANGKRIPVHYRILNDKGEEMASGKMNYG